MKLYIKITLALVLLMAIVGIFTALYLFTKQHKDLSVSKPDFVLTATEFLKEFETDEVSASIKYNDKIIEVSGIISELTPGEENTLSISLTTGSELSSVICTLPFVPDISELRPGEIVTIRGECSGYLMDVLLNNCVLIK